MFRPELKHDKKISRLSAAKTILNNVEDYTGMGAAYGDSQRFRYSATHFCSFLLLSNYLCVNDIWTCFFFRFAKDGTISCYNGSENENNPSTVLVWCCVSKIKSTISRVDGRLDSAKYSNLIAKNVIPLSEKTPSKMINYVQDW